MLIARAPLVRANGLDGNGKVLEYHQFERKGFLNFPRSWFKFVCSSILLFFIYLCFTRYSKYLLFLLTLFEE